MTTTTLTYRNLNPAKIVETITRLVRRIDERFPGCSLAKVARELEQISREAIVRAESIRRPNRRLRIGIGLFITLVVAVCATIVAQIRPNDDLLQFEHFFQSLDSLLASLFLIGATLGFLITIEVRFKRKRALQAIHELRALAHIVDMHQLTKDPERLAGRGLETESSPKRSMTPFELGRYLDYCGEMLSLISKIGALYVHDFPDTVALEAVDQLTSLTNGLARNIWQKIMILETIIGPAAVASTRCE